MANPSKARGTAAETALLRWLHDNGHAEAVRNPPAGVKDVGDLRCETWVYDPDDDSGAGAEHPVPVVIEVKAYKDLAAGINRGLAELEVEMDNAGATHGVLVVKRRGKGDPGDWLACRLVRNDPELGAS